MEEKTVTNISAKQYLSNHGFKDKAEYTTDKVEMLMKNYSKTQTKFLRVLVKTARRAQNEQIEESEKVVSEWKRRCEELFKQSEELLMANLNLAAEISRLEGKVKEAWEYGGRRMYFINRFNEHEIHPEYPTLEQWLNENNISNQQ